MSQDNELNAIAGESKNLTEHNIEQLKQLFPEVFAEGKIDFDALKAELGEHVETDDERYQFTWAGKAQAKRIATTPSLGTLRPAPEESVNWDSTENLYIEGDNLEVLKLLQKSYFGKVKMIYIDPPYNTGKDFVYKDDFKDNLANYKRLTNQVDGEGNPLNTNSDAAGRYHSNWLNMMYPRLKLARNLLKDDGVIFISIDDNEVHNLRKLCDEIFGEDNFISDLVWQKKVSPSNDAKFFSYDHEIILVYAKKKSEGVVSRLPRTEEHNKYYKNVDNDPRGAWNSTAATCNKNHMERPNLYYPIINPNNGEEVWPRKEAVWAFSKEKMHEFLDDDRLYWGSAGDSKSPRIKNFLCEAKKVVPRSILQYKDVGHTQSATNEIKSIMPDAGFDYPKPSTLIDHLIKISFGDNCEGIVLDFFSGSSTTAHAVMQLNAEDGGNRKFIMVQIPEPTPENSEARNAGYETIAEIGKERIRRAAAKIKEEHPDTTADLGFKVLKLDTSNIKKWQPNLDSLEQDLLAAADNIMPERSSEDLLFEVLLKYGLPLTLPVEKLTLGSQQVFNVAAGSLVACFDENITLETVQAIIGLSSEEQPVLRVVFRDNGFKDDTVKTNAIQRLKQAGIEDVLSI